jgi:hypothetical protein
MLHVDCKLSNHREKHVTHSHGRLRDYLLHKYEDLPEYLRDNFYITEGYRVHFDVKLCFHSLFRWHNGAYLK